MDAAGVLGGEEEAKGVEEHGRRMSKALASAHVLRLSETGFHFFRAPSVGYLRPLPYKPRSEIGDPARSVHDGRAYFGPVDRGVKALCGTERCVADRTQSPCATCVVGWKRWADGVDRSFERRNVLLRVHTMHVPGLQAEEPGADSVSSVFCNVKITDKFITIAPTATEHSGWKPANTEGVSRRLTHAQETSILYQNLRKFIPPASSKLRFVDESAPLHAHKLARLAQSRIEMKQRAREEREIEELASSTSTSTSTAAKNGSRTASATTDDGEVEAKGNSPIPRLGKPPCQSAQTAASSAAHINPEGGEEDAKAGARAASASRAQGKLGTPPESKAEEARLSLPEFVTAEELQAWAQLSSDAKPLSLDAAVRMWTHALQSTDILRSHARGVRSCADLLKTSAPFHIPTKNLYLVEQVFSTNRLYRQVKSPFDRLDRWIAIVYRDDEDHTTLRRVYLRFKDFATPWKTEGGTSVPNDPHEARLNTQSLHAYQLSDVDKALTILVDLLVANKRAEDDTSCAKQMQKAEQQGALWRQVLISMRMTHDATPYCQTLALARRYLHLMQCESLITADEAADKVNSIRRQLPTEDDERAFSADLEAATDKLIDNAVAHYDKVNTQLRTGYERLAGDGALVAVVKGLADDVEKLQRRITEAAEMPILPRGQAKGSQEAMDDPIDKLFQNFTVAGQVVQKMRSVATSLISNILHAQSSLTGKPAKASTDIEAGAPRPGPRGKVEYYPNHLRIFHILIALAAFNFILVAFNVFARAVT